MYLIWSKISGLWLKKNEYLTFGREVNFSAEIVIFDQLNGGFDKYKPHFQVLWNILV